MYSTTTHCRLHLSDSVTLQWIRTREDDRVEGGRINDKFSVVCCHHDCGLSLRIPGNWVLVSESRSGDPIKSNVKNFIALGCQKTWPKNMEGSKKGRKKCASRLSSLKQLRNYIHPPYTSPPYGDSRRVKTNGKAAIEQTPHRRRSRGPHRTTGATSSFPTRTSPLGRHGFDNPVTHDDWLHLT